MLAPGSIWARPAIAELVFEQSGERASATRTFVSVTLPVFVTTIVNGAFAPLAIVCSFTFFVIEMPGFGVTTQCLIASSEFAWPGAAVPVARVSETPPTVSVVEARTVSSPATERGRGDRAGPGGDQAGAAGLEVADRARE